MPVAPWPEWLPDQADFSSPGSPMIKNVVPLTARSYGGMPTFTPYTDNTLTARCQGAYSLKNVDGTVYIYAGDRTKLYRLPPASRTLVDVSRTTGGAYGTLSPPNGFWSMTSYGNRVVAANGIDPIQSMLLGASNFTPLAAAAPIAKFVCTVKDFLFTANTNDGVSGPVPYRVWWSALGDPTNWPTPGSITAQQLQSDYQDLQQTDLGTITGMVSGFGQAADVAIFTERGIWTAAYTGPPVLFSFRVAQNASGTISPLSLVQSFAKSSSGNVIPVVYYLGQDGFAAFDGSTSYPIGAQKFDREFFRELDPTYVQYVQGANDPRTRTIVWAFSAGVNTGGLFNRLLVYNWELSRGTIVELEPSSAWAEWLTTAMYAQSYTLDQLDPFGNLEVIQPPFDDPFWIGNASSFLSIFAPDHRLGIGRGPPMAPTLETGELQFVPERRAWVQTVRPLIDGGTATVAVGHRDRLEQPVVWEAAVPANVIGECPQRVTGRYLRFRMTMPAAQVFTHLQGLDIQAIPEGRLR